MLIPGVYVYCGMSPCHLHHDDLFDPIFSDLSCVVKTHQEQGRSYKEVCAPVIERLRFLFNELRPAVSNDLSIVSKLKLLSSQPRWKRITQKLIRDRRKKRCN